MRHLIDPLDFTQQEITTLLDLATASTTIRPPIRMWPPTKNWPPVL